MKRPQITCHKCEGKGEQPLDDVLWNTLQLLSKLKRVSAPEMYDKSPDKSFIVPSAINQRLEDLRRLDLVDREREGKVWKYFVKEQKA